MFLLVIEIPLQIYKKYSYNQRKYYFFFMFPLKITCFFIICAKRLALLVHLLLEFRPPRLFPNLQTNRAGFFVLPLPVSIIH